MNFRKQVRNAICLLVLVAGSATVVKAQGANYLTVISNSVGQPVPGATITVCLSSDVLAGNACPSGDVSLFSDPALTVPLVNPFHGDGLGNVSFWAAPGGYQVTVSGSNLTTTTSKIKLSCVSDMSAACGTTSPASFPRPDPYTDVNKFHVRAVNPAAIPNSRANCASGSANVSLTGGPSTFQNNDGVAIANCGALSTLSTPAAPTVIPSITSGAMNTGQTVALAGGATTYNYRIVERDKFGARTAAGLAGSTASGPVSLGTQPIAVASMSRSNAIISVVLSAPGFPVLGGLVYLTGSNDASFSGWYRIGTVTDNQHFTTTATGMDTRNGATTSASGGTAKFHLCNHLILPLHSPGGWEYLIYSDNGLGGAFSLVNVTKPLDTYFDDFGTTEEAGIALPADYPATPPSVATNDYLVTTIVSGAGTTSLALAASASNSVTGAVIKFDNTPNIIAAAKAAQRLTGTFRSSLFFPEPADAVSVYVVNSFLILPSSSTGLTIWQHGALYLNETIQTQNVSWYGDLVGGNAVCPQFAKGCGVDVQVITANPGIYETGGGGDTFSRLVIRSLGGPQGLLMVNDAAGNFFWNYEYVTFSGGGSGNDYLSIGYMGRGNAYAEFHKCAWLASSPTVFGSTNTPMAYFRDTQDNSSGGPGLWKITDSAFQERGVVTEASPAIGSGSPYNAINVYTTAMDAPLFAFQGINTGFVFHGESLFEDTAPQAYVANWGSNLLNRVELFTPANISAETGGVPGYLTGDAVTIAVLISMPAQSAFGQNVNVLRIPGPQATLGTNVNLTGQTANLAATTIYTTTSASSGAGAAGLYRVCATAWTTVTGNSTITINAIAPSGAGTVTFPLPQTLNMAGLTNPGGGCVDLHVAPSSAIQVSVTGYNTTGTYSIQAAVEQVF